MRIAISAHGRQVEAEVPDVGINFIDVSAVVYDLWLKTNGGKRDSDGTGGGYTASAERAQPPEYGFDTIQAEL